MIDTCCLLCWYMEKFCKANELVLAQYQYMDDRILFLLLCQQFLTVYNNENINKKEHKQHFNLTHFCFGIFQLLLHTLVRNFIRALIIKTYC